MPTSVFYQEKKMHCPLNKNKSGHSPVKSYAAQNFIHLNQVYVKSSCLKLVVKMSSTRLIVYNKQMYKIELQQISALFLGIVTSRICY